MLEYTAFLEADSCSDGANRDPARQWLVKGNGQEVDMSIGVPDRVHLVPVHNSGYRLATFKLEFDDGRLPSRTTDAFECSHRNSHGHGCHSATVNHCWDEALPAPVSYTHLTL